MVSKYSIKDLEKLSGIKAHTLRVWEQRYNIFTPNRTKTNIRYYGNDDLKKVLNIAVLVKNGMRISEIAAMKEGELNSAVLEMTKFRTTFESQINALKLAMLEFDEYLFESVFNRCLIQFGTETTFRDILGTFIEQIGTFWQVGAISVGNEHFISNLIRQKLFAIIDHTPLPIPKKNKNYIMFLPTDELHEIGLLYFFALLKGRGHRIIYLGQNAPLESVKEVSVKSGINQFISVFTTSPNSRDLPKFMDRLDNIFDDDSRFYLTGLKLKDYEHQKRTEKIIIGENFKILFDLLETK